MFNDYKDMVSIDETCEMLRIGRNKVYELLRSGTLGGFKEGRIWKIPKFAVEAYIMERSTRKNGTA